MSNQPSSKKYKNRNTRNLWHKAPERHSFSPMNCHLTMYEGRQGPRFTIAAERWQRCYEGLNRAPHTIAAIDSWLGKRNSFQSMPSNGESHKQLGLPDLTGTFHAGWVHPALKKRLDQCGFDDDGLSQLMAIDGDGFFLPANNVDWIKMPIHILLQHERFIGRRS
jgi:hypothetical protein